jgi:hypothetical protein
MLHPMSSPKPPALLPTGRMKWLWLAVAGALGLWLLVLLMVSGPDDEPREKPKTPFDGVSRKPKGFDTPATEAFSGARRPSVKAAKPSVPPVAAPDQGKSE